MDPLHVAVGVILDAGQNVLISRRPEGAHLGGLWEFPGGKVEAGESLWDALARELEEELGITIEEGAPLLKVEHAYPDKTVLLDVWLVRQFAGEAHGAEGQGVAWVGVDELENYPFPAANEAIVAAIRGLLPGGPQL